MTTTALVFDVGGTRIRAAIYETATGRLVAEDRRATPTRFTHPNLAMPQLVALLVDVMAEQAANVSGGRVPNQVGVAFAGPVFDGKVLRAPTIWGDYAGAPVPLTDLVSQLWPNARCSVLNDMTAAGYRYLRTPSEDLCLVTVSSGIGHKIFTGGRPALGPHGRGGEIGHLRIDYSPDAPLCECGGRGHLAAFTCGRASTYQANRLVGQGELTPDDVAPFSRDGHVDNRQLAQAFREGHSAASRIVAEMATPLGRCLGMLHLATGFERACIIGGFGLALGGGYVRLLADAAAESGWDTGLDWHAVLELGEPDDDSVLIGMGLALVGEAALS